MRGSLEKILRGGTGHQKPSVPVYSSMDNNSDPIAQPLISDQASPAEEAVSNANVDDDDDDAPVR